MIGLHLLLDVPDSSGLLTRSGLPWIQMAQGFLLGTTAGRTTLLRREPQHPGRALAVAGLNRTRSSRDRRSDHRSRTLFATACAACMAMMPERLLLLTVQRGATRNPLS